MKKPPQFSPRRTLPALALLAALAAGGCGPAYYEPAPGATPLPLKRATDECIAEQNRNPDAEDVREKFDQCMLDRGWQAVK